MQFGQLKRREFITLLGAAAGGQIDYMCLNMGRNDALQGNTVGIGFVMCGTPEFLLDTRRGLYSSEALQSPTC